MQHSLLRFSWLLALALGSANAATVVKIATISPLSGSNSNLGLQIRNGAQLAVDEMKAQFAKAGMTLSLVAYDDQAEPAIGTSSARRIITDKSILGVVGTLNSGVALPVSAALAPSHVTMISPANTNEQVTDRGLKNMNRICARGDAQGPAGAGFVAGTLKAKTVYVLNDRTPYGKSLADQAQQAMQAKGLKIVQSTGIAAEERDFTDIIAKIQALKPNAIYFGGEYSQVGLFVKQLRDKGVATPIVGGDGLDSDDLIRLAEGGANNIYFTTVAPPLDAVPAAKPAAASFQKSFGTEIQGFGIMGYDSAKVLLQGILNAYRAAGNNVPTRTQVETSVRGGTFSNLSTGEVKFDKNGDRRTAKMYVIAIKNGQRTTAGTLNVVRK